ncbi:MAG TPA: chaperone modulator CbpM [Gammaproteobacteria bacterium]|nr:chaperone modulator CbpM [Gammaproteobacteria bacterium]
MEGDPKAIQTPEPLGEVGLDELCVICHVAPEFVFQLVEYGTIEPEGPSATSWRFNARQIHVISTAVRLHHDLEVNHAGIALAIDLMNQVESLQAELTTLRRYFVNSR